MRGNDDVEKLMPPVSAAIRRHIKWPSDAFTDIYNRAYEAVYHCITTSDALRAELAEARAAIAGILAKPYGCPMCDSGKLRNPEKSHWADCPYAIANDVLGLKGEINE